MREKIGTETKVELRLVNHCTVLCCGVNHKFEGSKDGAVLVMVTTLGGSIIAEKVLALVVDIDALLTLRSYIAADGGLTLHRDL